MADSVAIVLESPVAVGEAVGVVEFLGAFKIASLVAAFALVRTYPAPKSMTSTELRNILTVRCSLYTFDSLTEFKFSLNRGILRCLLRWRLAKLLVRSA
jgi:hypothetical protein